MGNKVALITGITGQDGSYLAELLLEKGYDVHGVARRTSLFNRTRIEDARAEAVKAGKVYELQYGDMGDSSSLNRIITETRPDELYNLAGDPLVQKDLAEKMPERVAEMESRLMGLIEKGRSR